MEASKAGHIQFKSHFNSSGELVNTSKNDKSEVLLGSSSSSFDHQTMAGANFGNNTMTANKILLSTLIVTQCSHRQGGNSSQDQRDILTVIIIVDQ